MRKLLKFIPGALRYKARGSVYGGHYPKCFCLIQSILPPEMALLTHVRISDLIEASSLNKKGLAKAQARMAEQIIDFVVVRRDDFSIVLPIALDHVVSGWKRWRTRPDTTRDSTLIAAELPVLYVTVDKHFVSESIREQILHAAGHLLGIVHTETETVTVAAAAPAKPTAAPEPQPQHWEGGAPMRSVAPRFSSTG